MSIDEVDSRYQGDHSVSTDGAHTDDEWAYVLALCQRRYAIGFGVLDSFLSGPDLQKRIELVEAEVKSNDWLRRELRDTIALDQSKDWPDAAHQRLQQAAGSDEGDRQGPR